MPKVLKTIWAEFVRGGFITSLCTVATIYSVAIILNKAVKLDFIFIVFLTTLTIYFLNFIGELEEDMRDRPLELKSIKKHRNFYYFLIILLCLINLILIFTYANSLSTIFILSFIALGIFYTFGLKKLTEKILGFKDIFVIIAWNFLTPFFIVYHGYEFSTAVWILMLFIFTRDWVNANFSDLKDITVDQANGLKTFAVVFGKNKLILSLHLASIMSIILLIWGVYSGYIPVYSLSLIGGVLITAIFVQISQTIKNYSTTFVDSEAFFWILFLLLAKKIWI